MEEAVTRSVATMSLAFIINSTPWIIKQIIVACLGNEVKFHWFSTFFIFEMKKGKRVEENQSKLRNRQLYKEDDGPIDDAQRGLAIVARMLYDLDF